MGRNSVVSASDGVDGSPKLPAILGGLGNTQSPANVGYKGH